MRTFETPEPITLALELGAGSARILASDRTDTTVEVRPRDRSSEADRKAAEQTRVELAGGTLHVRALTAWRRFTVGSNGVVDVTIELPTGSVVRARTGLGDLYTDGQLGDCSLRSGMGRLGVEEARNLDLHTGFGDVTADSCTGDADVATSGTVRIRRIGGTAVVKNSNGNTWLGSVGGDLRVKASSGDIEIGSAGASVTARTAAGTVRLGDVIHGRIEIQSAAGDIEIGIREGTSAWLDLEARHGTVRNELEKAEPPEQPGNVVEVRARTYGDVSITRPAAEQSGGPGSGAATEEQS